MMKTKLLLSSFLLCLLFSHNLRAQGLTFQQSFQGILYGEALWINSITNQPKKDLVLTGYTSNYDNHGFIYRGSSNYTTQDSILQLGYASSDKLDVNNDGYMDFVVIGTPEVTLANALVYVNQGNGQFIADSTIIPNVTQGRIASYDFNNDGAGDIIVSGINDNYTNICELYMNDGTGNFQLEFSFFGNNFGSIDAFDANGDGYLDVVITGFTASGSARTQLYLNDGTQQFTEQNTLLPHVYFSDTDHGDIDNDGDDDILIAGYDLNYLPSTKIFLNDGLANFTELNQTTLTDVYFGTATFVDVDNNGTLDVHLTGNNGSIAINKLFYNTNGTFTEDTTAPFVDGVYISNAEWDDYDFDGDKDLVVNGITDNNNSVTQLYNNEWSNYNCPRPHPIQNTILIDTVAHFVWQGITQEENGYSWTLNQDGVALQTGNTNTGDTSLVINNLQPESNYELIIITNCLDTISGPSIPYNFTTDSLFCLRPSLLTHEGINQSVFNFTWDEPLDLTNIQQYEWALLYAGAPYNANNILEQGSINTGNTSLNINMLNTVPSQYDLYLHANCEVDTNYFLKIRFDNLSLSTDDLNTTISDFIVYPNPFDSYLEIEVIQSIQFFTLLDLQGNKIMTLPVNQDKMYYNLNHLPSGSYIIVPDHNILGAQTIIKQ